MIVWGLRQDTTGASQLVFETHPYSASPSVGSDVAHFMELEFRGASQLADRDVFQLAVSKFGLVVALPRAPSSATQRRIMDQAAQDVSTLEVDAFLTRLNLPVMRLLVGECNLSRQESETASQMVPSLPDFDVNRWQVGDAPFIRQAFDSARLPC